MVIFVFFVLLPWVVNCCHELWNEAAAAAVFSDE
jgi:hypothetical protein